VDLIGFLQSGNFISDLKKFRKLYVKHHLAYAVSSGHFGIPNTAVQRKEKGTCLLLTLEQYETSLHALQAIVPGSLQIAYLVG